MKRDCLTLGALTLFLVGCGNAITTEIIGTTGVVVDDNGNPVVLIEVCEGAIDHVDLAGTREGLADDEPNRSFGEWTATEPQDGSIEVNIVTGTPGWDGPKLMMESGHGYIAEGNSSTDDVVASQAVFTAPALAQLAPDQVIVGDGEVVSRSEFKAGACKDPG